MTHDLASYCPHCGQFGTLPDGSACGACLAYWNRHMRWPDREAVQDRTVAHLAQMMRAMQIRLGAVDAPKVIGGSK